MPTSRLVPELIVSDLGESLKFYVDLIGFRVLYERPEARFVFLDLGGAHLMLEQPKSRDRLWPKAELTKPFGRGVNFEIDVEDVERLHSVCEREGHELFLPLEERWYRRDVDEIGVRQFALHDPDGYLIRFSQVTGTRPIAR